MEGERRKKEMKGKEKFRESEEQGKKAKRKDIIKNGSTLLIQLNSHQLLF